MCDGEAQSEAKSPGVNINTGDEILILHLYLKSTITPGRQIETGLQIIISSNSAESCSNSTLAEGNLPSNRGSHRQNPIAADIQFCLR